MKIIIYGLGNNYIQNKDWLLDEYEVVALADGNPNRYGELVDGYKVIGKQEILTLDYDCVVVTPNIFPEIIHELLKAGIPQGKVCTLNSVRREKTDTNRLRICFRIGGGMGDALIAVNYVEAFRKQIKHDCYLIDLAVDLGGFEHSDKLVRDLIGEWKYGNIIPRPEKVDMGYDLTINLLRYPEIYTKNTGKIARLAPELIDYILLCEKFKMLNPRFFTGQYVADGCSAYMAANQGQNRLQQPDIYGYLGIAKEYGVELEADSSLLEVIDLKNEKYITLHHGTSPKHHKYDAVKTWSAEYYEQLICMLKEEYPGYKTVLLGEKYEEDDAIHSFDISLVGKLSVAELKAVLKNAALHIDVEGGLVHLRHALKGGPSIVLFGPTLPRFYGYSENYNLRTDACAMPCEWITDDWMRKCVRRTNKGICMRSLQPEYVMNSVRKVMGKNG